MKHYPLVTIILPVFNQEETISLCILSLVHQTYPKTELIVVEDGSTDGTLKLLERMVKDQSFNIIHTKHIGRSSTRNLGLQFSRGEIVVFAEGDAVYDQNYVLSCLEYFDNTEVGGVFVWMQVYKPKTWLQKCFYLERQIWLQNYKPFSAWVYRKEVLEEVGGFDQNLNCAEDQDLAIRITEKGYRIAFERKNLWWHQEPRNLSAFAKRSFWSGIEKVDFYRKYPRKTQILNIVGLAYLTICGTLSLFIKELPTPFLISILFAISTKLLLTLRRGWHIGKIHYLLLIPLVSMIRNFASTLGLFYGCLSRLHSFIR